MQFVDASIVPRDIRVEGFELWFQPVYNFSDGTVQHNEVLLRWRDSKGKLFRPRDFMPWVTQANLRLSLDKLVIRMACRQLAAMPRVRLSINLSAESVGHAGFSQFIFDELQQANIDPASVQFEIAEPHAARNLSHTIHFVRDLREIGCAVVLDNFANDYLTYMQWERLEVDQVKLNGRLLSQHLSQKDRLHLLRSIADASNQMGQIAVAKSLDEAIGARWSHHHQFDSGQGYQFKRPSQQISLASKVDVLGLALDNWSKTEFIEQLHEGIVFAPNVNHLMNIRRDSDYRKAYTIADYKICNSQVLYFASQFLGEPLQEKITAAELLPLFCTYHQNNPDYSLFILSEGESAPLIQAKVNRQAGRPFVIDTYQPSSYFDCNEVECQAIVHHINRSQANVLVLGIRSPVQEKWVYRYRDRLPQVKLILALGEAVLVEAGLEARPPEVVSDMGVEWLFRLLQHPQQLWRRYLINDAPFLLLLIKHKLFQ
ncbi:EAL domain-containing protein [Lyngbya confervoides]|uniref:EAL domain-containing protein n=1 Tax=Lyngbya confervoides BDU141951 TaxID=1574623 RepID=A0ABD4SX34_9CYAN|nr:EAL domain-containing protein [Lyngbya confervoides]MCM1981261.1 EAL domain-containing protein [Lyngbya confervoides BDU141951]